MPTYEYECKSCNHNFEAFQSMSDDPLRECPLCKKEIRRLINGGSGIIFKGSGFYVNDKNKSAKTASSKPEEKSADKSGSKETPGVNAGAAACASCPAAGGSCPAAEKAAG